MDKKKTRGWNEYLSYTSVKKEQKKNLRCGDGWK